MLGQLRNEIGKRAVASSRDAAADDELVAVAKKVKRPQRKAAMGGRRRNDAHINAIVLAIAKTLFTNKS